MGRGSACLGDPRRGGREHADRRAAGHRSGRHDAPSRDALAAEGCPGQCADELRAQWTPLDAVSIGAALLAASRQYARGDENNADANGAVPGYAILNLDARWRFTPNFELFANVNNVFNVHYQNFGILGANLFRGPDNTFAPDRAAPEAFRAPGAPIGAWIGLRYRFEVAT